MKGPSPFPQTLWTLVLEGAGGDEEKARDALGQLCVLYREPIRSWLERNGTHPNDVEDLTQGFIQYILQGHCLRNYQRQEPRFRSFLIVCLEGYQRDQWHKARAAKRGGGVEHLDVDNLPLGSIPEQDKSFDLGCALNIHRLSLEDVQAEYYASDAKAIRFRELCPFLWREASGDDYAQIGLRLGLARGAVKKAMHDLRHRYLDFFRDKVRRTVPADQVAEEYRYLFALVAKHEGA